MKIIELARQAGVRDDEHRFEFSEYKYLERFAALVAAHEREECAKLCETLWDTPINGMATEEECYGNECAAAIRARGTT